MKDVKVLSVVIGIRDWEPERLELAIRSHLDSSIGAQIEVIVSDYGSSNPTPIRDICIKHECVYKYTDADVWSRSRALNIGLSVARSEYMLTTDADIIFAPRTLEATVDSLKLNPNSVVLAQCSNLSKDFSLLRAMSFPWEEIYADAVLRPRWGMGGLCAFSQSTLDVVRGFEERMVVWGSEDNDFVKRCRQAGRYMHWISGVDVGIYHVWHPPYLEVAPKSDNIHEINKEILNNDFTTSRNYLGEACYIPRKPLVSINIASYNRGHLIGDVIQSLLNQTVQDFEILIYDDGSEDDTDEVIASFSDPRIRYFKNTSNLGVATARNNMVKESRGQYICVHDDDDIMLPNRLELQLDAMTVGFVGSYGGWVDYDSMTGQLSRQPGKEPFGVSTVAFTGSALAHGTLMVQTDVMKRIGYETSFRGGSDYNLAFRMATAGYKLKHCGDYVILRRVHSQSLTAQSSDKQKLSSRITIAPFLNCISTHVEKQLRAEAKCVKNVHIDSYYNDIALTNFLPEDVFDHLVDVRYVYEPSKYPLVNIYKKDKDSKCFALLTSADDEILIPSSLSDDAYCRIPKPTFDVEDNSEYHIHINAIAKNLRAHLYGDNDGVVASLQFYAKKNLNLEEAIGVYSHLVNSIAIVEYEKKNFVIVDASSHAVANLVAYSIRTTLTDTLRISQSCTVESLMNSVETTPTQGLHS